MSQTTEECEKFDLQELEEHLNKIKECGDYIKKSYKNAKEKYDEIVEKDQSTVEYKKSFRKIVKHLRNVCKETVKKFKDLEENVLSKTYKIRQSEKLSEIECEVSEQDTSPSRNNDNVNKEQINGEEKADDNKSECSESSDQHMARKKKKKEIRKARKAGDSNKSNSDDIDTVSRNGVEDTVPNANELESQPNKATSSEQKKKEKDCTGEKDNLDKENEKPEENSVERIEIKDDTKDPPKGIIRVISIEKLLDPSIAALRKRPQRPTQCSNLLNSSVIVLDSDDDEPTALVVPQKDTPFGNAKRKETVSKTVNKETTAPKVSKSIAEEKRNDENKKNQSNPKLKKVAVRLKSSKLLKEMLEKKGFKIKLSKLEKGLDSEPEPNEDRSTASAKILRKRNSINRQRQQPMSSSSEEDDNDDNGRRKTNVKAN